MNCKCVGSLQGGKWDHVIEKSRRVYDPQFVSPAITTFGGGEQTIKILVRQATKDEYAECIAGGVADLGFPNSATRRGRVQNGGGRVPDNNVGNADNMQNGTRQNGTVENPKAHSARMLEINGFF